MSMEAQLATWELKKSDVNSREKFFLLSLARRAGEDHTCWPSINRMVEDTGFDRKTIVDIRQALLEKKIISYTGRMVGRSGQIPEMKLNYVEKWEEERKRHLSKDYANSVDNYPVQTSTSTENGTGTSTENGTGTSTENGTRNIKLENKNRNKSFYVNEEKKNRPVNKSNYIEKNTMSDEYKKTQKAKPESLDKFMESLPKGLRSKRYRKLEGDHDKGQPHIKTGQSLNY